MLAAMKGINYCLRHVVLAPSLNINAIEIGLPKEISGQTSALDVPTIQIYMIKRWIRELCKKKQASLEPMREI